MDFLWSVFSTRELAAGLWLGVGALWALSVASIRRSIAGIIKALCAPVLLKLAFVSVAFVCGVVWVLSMVGVWDLFLLKDTVYWVVFSGIVIAGRSLSDQGDEGLLKTYIADHLKIIVVLQGLIAAHTFSLPVELVLLPVVTLIVLLQAVAEVKDEFSQIRRPAEILLALAGLLIVGSVISRILQDPAGLVDGVLVRRAILPLVLSIGFLPAALLLALYSAYETLFVRLNIGSPKEAAFKRYAKWRLFRHLGWKPSNVWRFSRRWAGPLMRTRSKEELDALLTEDREDVIESKSGTNWVARERQTSDN